MTISAKGKIFDAHIYSVSGSLVKSYSGLADKHIFSSSELGNPGLYFVKVIMENETKIEKLIVK